MYEKSLVQSKKMQMLNLMEEAERWQQGKVTETWNIAWFGTTRLGWIDSCLEIVAVLM